MAHDATTSSPGEDQGLGVPTRLQGPSPKHTHSHQQVTNQLNKLFRQLTLETLMHTQEGTIQHTLRTDPAANSDRHHHELTEQFNQASAITGIIAPVKDICRIPKHQ